MNTLLFSAGVVCLIVGLIHSVLGEILIFKHLRNGTIIPTIGKPLLKERNIRIIWASWHIVTIFGWAFGAMLFHISSIPLDGSASIELFINATAWSMFACSALVVRKIFGLTNQIKLCA